MDPFKHFLSTEGCSSNESGWTRYLASPKQDDFECSEDNYKNSHNINDVDDGEGNSDDSMVSDASSAPTHHQYKHNNDPGNSNARVKHNKGEYTSKHSSSKEAKKEVKKSAENSGKSKKRLDGQTKYRK